MQYDGTALHCLLSWMQNGGLLYTRYIYIVLTSMRCIFVTTVLESLYDSRIGTDTGCAGCQREITEIQHIVVPVTSPAGGA